MSEQTTIRAAVLVAFVAFLIVAACVLRLVLWSTYVIVAGSMEPTMQVDDRVLFASWDTDPERGEIVAFRAPPILSSESDLAIARVVGLAGEEVELRDGLVFVDGTEIDEPYLSPGTRTEVLRSSPQDVSVPAGHVFVLGDNRENSLDSRIYGSVPVTDIEGTRRQPFFWPSFLP